MLPSSVTTATTNHRWSFKKEVEKAGGIVGKTQEEGETDRMIKEGTA
tara:strand:+ start:222 stop:362 length:141 start_codon:yes stop_codon:yes gene_type:complete